MKIVDGVVGLEAGVAAVLQRALAIFSQDPDDDFAQLHAALSSRQRDGLFLLVDGQPCGLATWQYEDEARHFAAVELLFIDAGVSDPAVEMLVDGLWARLMADPALDMIALRVHDVSDVVRAALLGQGVTIFERHMMTCDLLGWSAPADAANGAYQVVGWTDEHQAGVEALAPLAQKGNIDEIVVPDAQADRMVTSIRKIRAGTYPNVGPFIAAASLVVLDAGGNVAGYLAAVDMGMLPFISEVAVHPDHRRRGLGRLLVEHSMAALREQRFPLVGLVVTGGNPALKLYEKLGFHTIQVGEMAVWWRDGRQQRWHDERQQRWRDGRQQS
ncbi:GNAT family N-acetyltransferase [Chloroflexota bacterium]